MVISIMAFLWGIVEFLSDILALGLGLDPNNLSLRDEKLLAATTLTIVPTLVYQSFQRIRILRLLVGSEKTTTEGTWLEKIQRDGESFVTMVRIKRKLFSNTYSIYGETLKFDQNTHRDPTVYATFRSDNLHFHCEDNVILTFNYNSSISQSEYNRTGLARYEFPRWAKTSATGWFVGVLDGNGNVRENLVKDNLDLHRVTVFDWLKRASEENKLLKTWSDWRFFCAYCVHKEMGC